MNREIIITFWYHNETFTEVWVDDKESAERVIKNVRDTINAGHDTVVTIGNVDGQTELVSIQNIKNIYYNIEEDQENA